MNCPGPFVERTIPLLRCNRSATPTRLTIAPAALSPRYRIAGFGFDRAVQAWGYSANLLDNKAAGRQRSQQFTLRTGQVEPGKPVGSIEHDDLTIMDRRHVGSGLGREDRKCLARAVRHRTP